MNPLLETMLILFAMMLIGFVANKTKIMTENTSKEISNIILTITNPCLIIASVLGDGINEMEINVFQLLLIGVLYYGFLILFAKILVKFLPVKGHDATIYEFMLIFANIGYMGYPVFRSLFGEEAIFLSVLINMPFNLLIFSYGAYAFAKAAGVKENFHWKDLLSPGLVSSVIALVLYFMRLNVPEVVYQPLGQIGVATVPLSMLIIGFSLGQINLMEAFKDVATLGISFVRLIILPVVVFFILRIFVQDPFLLQLVTINAALPSASLIVVFATKYDVQVKISTVGIFLTTLFSIISIPFIGILLF